MRCDRKVCAEEIGMGVRLHRNHRRELRDDKSGKRQRSPRRFHDYPRRATTPSKPEQARAEGTGRRVPIFPELIDLYFLESGE